jgi:hypothetical protein
MGKGEVRPRFSLMPDPLICLARTQLGVPDSELARRLGAAVGCSRSWRRKGAPRYARLALCALIVGLNPKAFTAGPAPLAAA